ncbi:SpoIIE family protein phosphatase [Streptomyces sp. 900116325]
MTRRRLTEPGSLVLVTDGVVEGPACPLEKGLDEVVQLMRGGYDGDPDRPAGEVIKVADLTGHRDDAAVLVVRYAGIPSAG